MDEPLVRSPRFIFFHDTQGWNGVFSFQETREVVEIGEQSMNYRSYDPYEPKFDDGTTSCSILPTSEADLLE